MKISRKKMMIQRLFKLKRRIKIDTQRMRAKTLKSLDELFTIAKKLAKDKKLELKQREKWMRVAAYICQVIGGLTSGYDERQIDVQLDELERLVNEARSKADAKKLKNLKLEQREKRLPKDPVRFFTEILRIKPYPYQGKFLTTSLL